MHDISEGSGSLNIDYTTDNETFASSLMWNEKVSHTYFIPLTFHLLALLKAETFIFIKINLYNQKYHDFPDTYMYPETFSLLNIVQI